MPPTVGPADEAWLRSKVETLSAIERPSVSPGEREAAEWLVGELAAAGVDQVELEAEPDSHGTYWIPHGLLSGAGAVLGLAALRGGRSARVAAVVGGAVATALGVDEIPPRGRRFRRLLSRKTSHHVVASIGSEQAEKTVVVLVHHDAAHSGLVFNPAIPGALERVAPWAFAAMNTSPPLMWPVVFGPGVVALGALIGSRKLIALGTAISAGTTALMVDAGLRSVVPGANDNATGVAVAIALAGGLTERPTESVRVMIVSTSEEAFCEGMGKFMARHGDELPLDSTFFLSIDTVGSPHLTVLRGEGALRVRDYRPESLALADTAAEDLGIELYPNLRLRNATDGVYPLNAGYHCISMASCTRLKQPDNYHWPTDTADNVNYGSVADALRLSEEMIRRLDRDWI